MGYSYSESFSSLDFVNIFLTFSGGIYIDNLTKQHHKAHPGRKESEKTGPFQAGETCPLKMDHYLCVRRSFRIRYGKRKG